MRRGRDGPANAFNALAGLMVAIGRDPKPRRNDLMIAATAVAKGIPLHTANVDDFKGLESMLEVVGVRPVRAVRPV